MQDIRLLIETQDTRIDTKILKERICNSRADEIDCARVILSTQFNYTASGTFLYPNLPLCTVK